ncbi:glycosyltransferase family 9 protein [Pelosinus sp. sgz500959]|uniref:glycosyltransferase family 9 protein n=1 Tax=Pelosinus sp. sgz500959 TaxID=3242472 RepID=UPI00366ED251
MKKILIINRLGIGDVVLTTPLAQAIKEHIPTAQIGILVSQKAVDVVTNHPYIDEVFGYQRSTKKEILAQIRSKNYEQALILDERITSTILAFQAGCRLGNKGFEVTIGKYRIFIRKKLAENAILDYTSYLKYLDSTISIPTIQPIVGSVEDGSLDKINTWLQENDFARNKLILIAARGLSENKNWPPEYFAELNVYFNKQGIIPVYLGSKNDEQYIASIAGEKYSAAGYFTLREVAVLAQYAAGCISLCTGVMHLVATAQIPIIALYGPTSPERWAPCHASVLKADLSCVPCERLDCRNSVYKQCMKNIHPQQVIDVMEKEGWLK